MALTAQDIAQAQDLALREVEVPEWGGSVYLRTLGAGDGIAFLEALDTIDPKAAVAFSLATVLCDENRKPLYADPHQGMNALQQRSSSVLNRLYDEAIKMNGIDNEADTARSKECPDRSGASPSS